jgi:hypothetical protein
VWLAYQYGYNSDGVRVWKRDGLNRQEYRYVCRIGCGGVPMRVYNRAMGGGSWASVEDYLPAGKPPHDPRHERVEIILEYAAAKQAIVGSQ